ncbi:MAG: hypothetical protein IIA17_05905 [candidate division Zixibacteria bacterium]|nr:hypothetical protein [candidate division Zixibacteria bacterium]
MQKLNGILGLLSIGLLLVISYGCSDSGSPTDGGGNGGGNGGTTDTVSFANDVRPILLASCAIAACHGSAPIQGGLNMGTASWSAIRAASGTNGGLAVVAGNASSSTLYTKTTLNPPFLSRMPFGRTPLSTAQQIAIRDWIDQGALDN